MKLPDYRRMVEATFDGDDIDRVWSLVEMAWNSGVRSGAQQGREKRAGKVEWDDWEWTEERMRALVRYAQDHYFGDNIDAAAVFVTTALRAGENWAKGKGIKRPDWLSTMRGIVDRRLAEMPPPTAAQTDLFARSSTVSSVPSRSSMRNQERQSSRREAAQSLLGRQRSDR